VMRPTIWLAGALLAVSSQVASVGCGSDSSAVTCDEGGCECSDRSVCELDCGDVVGCQPTCLGFGNQCSATCFDDCEFRCRQGNDCGGLCGDNCYTHCSSVESCSVETGANSEYRCLNATNCSAEIGDASTAFCTAISNSCSVRCIGICTVFCIDVGSCSVECVQGERTSCGQGVYTCGTECP
jgi:hypothetical protein